MASLGVYWENIHRSQKLCSAASFLAVFFLYICIYSHFSTLWHGLWITGVKDLNVERQRTGSPAAFLVNGGIHQYIGLAEPRPNEKLGYLQLCIYDSEHEVYNRSISQIDLTLDTDIIEALQEELHACNPHVRVFKEMDMWIWTARTRTLILFCAVQQASHLAKKGPTDGL